MSTAERVLTVATAALALSVIALCWYLANSPESYGGGGPDSPMPMALLLAPAASTAATIFALVAVASSAALLFLRAARWTGVAADATEATPGSSP